MAAVPTTHPATRLVGSPAEVAGRLYEAHHHRVLRYCSACLRSREEAEDAAQSTFLYALRALERGVEPEAEIAWLLAIARNVCMARHRTSGRRRERESPRDPILLQDVSAAPERTDALAGLEDALARLPETQRQAILLREWRGFSYREIAKELGVSGAAVETLIFRARRSLAEQLDGERAHERRRALRGLDVGSAAAALKSFLGAGTAAKLVVGAATVASVLAVAGGTVQQDRLRRGVEPASVGALDPGLELREHLTLQARAAATATPPSATGGTRRGERKADKQTTPGPAGGSKHGLVESGVAGVGGEVSGVLPELPQMPHVPETIVPPLPDLPVDPPAVPELSTPDLPLP